MSFAIPLQDFIESADGNSHLTQFIDWSARQHDVLYCVAWGNENNTPWPRKPQDNYNGLTIAASVPHDGPTFNRYSINVNAIEGDADGDRTSIDLLAPGENVAMMEPGDIPVFGGEDGTSIATAHATGAVAILQQYVAEQIADFNPRFFGSPERHEVMKAVMLNSADKIAGVHGSNRTILDSNGNQAWQQNGLFAPLHEQVGAGHLNVGRAVEQLQLGEYDPGVVPLIGWDYHTIGGSGATQEYYFDSAIGGDYVAITLTWDRRNEHSGGSTYHEGDTFFNQTLEDSLNNLDVYLMEADATDPLDYIWASRSWEDNVEHIFYNNFPAGNYKIVVRNNEIGGIGDSQNYALAWRFGSPPPDDLFGDFNSDGSVDSADYVMWRKDNGVGSYAEWVENFGSSSGAGGEVSVPEPPTSLLLITAILCVGLLSGRRLSATGPAYAPRA
jgi:hypothetical protein